MRPFSIALDESLPLPTPTPTLPRLLPITTVALKLNFFPPFTTLNTR